MNSSKRERRDWMLFLVLLLLGICLMLIAGQFAVSLASPWNVNANMHSELDPDRSYSGYQQVDAIAPIRPEILTPPAWGDSFLTPQPGIGLTLYPIFTFEPSRTPFGPTPAASTTPAAGSPTPPVAATFTSAPNPTNTSIVIIIWPTKTKIPDSTDPPGSPSNTPTTAPSVPEIVVEGLGAVNIADGSTYDLGSTTIFSPLNRTITVRNTGTATLNLFANPPMVTGNFAVTNFGSTSLAAGASTTFDLTCNATGLGSPVSGTVSFSNNDSDESPFNFTVTCTVTILPAPEIVVEGPGPVNIADGSTYDLGTTTLGTQLTRTITVRNIGTAALNLLTAPPTVTGNFAVTNFGSTSLAAGASTTFSLTCNATALGSPVSGTVSFGNNDSDENPFDFTVTCTVNAPEIVVEGPGPVNIADGGTYDLGTTTLGTPLTQTVTVWNIGTSALTLTNPSTVTGNFAATNFGSTSLAAGASTTFDLTCNATAVGAPVSGTVSFSNNDSDENPFNFTVTCTVNAPEIVVQGPPGATNIADGGTYDLGTTTLGAPLTQMITVRNTGTATLNLTTPPTVFTGNFGVSPFGSTSLAAGDSTTFNLTCNATSPGSPVSDTVSFGNNDSNENPFDFTVTCTVNAPEIVVEGPPGATNIADGGTYNLGTTTFGTSLTQTITVRNTGTAILNLTTPPTIVGDFAATNFGSTSLAAGASTTFNLTCNAAVFPGSPVSGTVSFGNNDGDENPFNFTVTCIVDVPPSLPPGVEIGPPDGIIDRFYGTMCFTVSPAISSGSGYDFVYYEHYDSFIPGIYMDQIVVQISADNNNWVTVLNWGDGSPDTNTNIAGFSPESEHLPIPAGSLYNNSGIEIDIPTGNYPYICFIAPTGGDGAEVDAIELLH
jgi:hypothetical protein